jgi:signal transduction histidine kinase
MEASRTPRPGGLEVMLADMLGDRSLHVLYPRTGDVWVNGVGAAAAPAPDQAITPVKRGEETVALIAHRRGLLDGPGLVDEIAAAAGLTFDNERLHAETQAQLADLRASRARVVSARDAERRRLERALHDGAQQRLVSLALALRLAALRAGADPAVAPRLTEALAEVSGALAELRTLARGIFPRELADEGLGAALETLAEGRAVEVDSVPGRRHEPAVETAAYFVVARAVARCSDRATVTVTDQGHKLRVEVVGTAMEPAEWIELEDRLGALDGSLSVEPGPRNLTRIMAELPCGS